jgi:hypothetical protein
MTRERRLRRSDPTWLERERARCVRKMTNAVQCKWPEKRRARWAVSNAIRRGKLFKPGACSQCHFEFEPHLIQAHHEDYSRPLDVIWACAVCHAILDGRARMDTYSPAPLEAAA